MTESDQTSERRRIDRRKMLAGMGATAAIGWTAPVIVDSVLNPAYALTSATPGCYLFYFKSATNNCHPVLKDTTDTNCTVSTPTGCSSPSSVTTASDANTQATLTTNGTKSSSKCTNFSFSVAPGYSCRILRYTYKDTTCTTVDPAANTTSVGPVTTTNYSDLYVYVACG